MKTLSAMVVTNLHRLPRGIFARPAGSRTETQSHRGLGLAREEESARTRFLAVLRQALAAWPG